MVTDEVYLEEIKKTYPTLKGLHKGQVLFLDDQTEHIIEFIDKPVMQDRLEKAIDSIINSNKFNNVPKESEQSIVLEDFGIATILDNDYKINYCVFVRYNENFTKKDRKEITEKLKSHLSKMLEELSNDERIINSFTHVRGHIIIHSIQLVDRFPRNLLKFMNENVKCGIIFNDHDKDDLIHHSIHIAKFAMIQYMKRLIAQQGIEDKNKNYAYFNCPYCIYDHCGFSHLETGNASPVKEICDYDITKCAYKDKLQDLVQ
jgi:hypothetical protein